VTSPVQNGAIIEPYLDSFRNKLSNNIKFTDIDRYGAPLLCHIPFGKRTCKKVPHGAASSRPLLTLKDLKTKEIQMDLTSMYDEEAFQISAVKKCRVCFLQERTEFEDD
jgi:hypothetical protein